MNTIHTAVARQGLLRPTENRVFGGVCAGVARRYGLDAWAVRVLLILILMVLPGSQLLVYPIAWILMPADGFVPLAQRPVAPPMTGAPAAPATGAAHATPQDTVLR